MKKSIFVMFMFCMGVSLFAQNLRETQIRFNNTVFTLGQNTYERDYNLIFNQWYQGHTSVRNLRAGESLDWVNEFTREYSISTNDYDIILNQINVGNNFRTIIFTGESSDYKRYIYMIYDNLGKLVLVAMNSAGNHVEIFSRVTIPRQITMANRGLVIYATELYQFHGDVIFELKYNLTSLSSAGITEINIGLVDQSIREEFRKAVQWRADYQRRTGSNPSNDLAGFEYRDSSIRITREREERERLEREEQNRLEQAMREEEERIAREQRERERLQQEEQNKLEQARREEERRIAREQERERLQREEQAILEYRRQQMRLEEWYNSFMNLSAMGNIRTFVVNYSGREHIITVNQRKQEVVRILEGACLHHNEFSINQNPHPFIRNVSVVSIGKTDRTSLVDVIFERDRVKSINLGSSFLEGPAGQEVRDAYGILTIITDGIRLW
jgi:hypothetical protein